MHGHHHHHHSSKEKLEDDTKDGKLLDKGKESNEVSQDSANGNDPTQSGPLLRKVRQTLILVTEFGIRFCKFVVIRCWFNLNQCGCHILLAFFSSRHCSGELGPAIKCSWTRYL